MQPLSSSEDACIASGMCGTEEDGGWWVHGEEVDGQREKRNRSLCRHRRMPTSVDGFVSRKKVMSIVGPVANLSDQRWSRLRLRIDIMRNGSAGCVAGHPA